MKKFQLFWATFRFSVVLSLYSIDSSSLRLTLLKLFSNNYQVATGNCRRFRSDDRVMTDSVGVLEVTDEL
jgi:hypothetical protein